MTTIDFAAWTSATANLTALQQRAFKDVLTLVKDGKSHLAFSADYVDGKPCLVNHVGHMLTVGGGQGIPSANFGALVSAFDSVNRMLREHGVNESDGFVTPLAAEFLLANFGAERAIQTDDSQWEAAREQVKAEESSIPAATGTYHEPSDDEFAQYLMTMATDIAAEAQDTLSNDDADNVTETGNVPVRLKSD